MTATYQPIRNGRYIDASTDLTELVASTDSSGGAMRCILKRLLAEAKRSSTQYQIIHIRWNDAYTYEGDFELTVQLTRNVGIRPTDFAFTLHHHYPFRAPIRMTVNGATVSHETYAALELVAGVPPIRTPSLTNGIGSNRHTTHPLCDEVKQELKRACPRCLYCQLYGAGTWSPSKFLGTQVDEYLAVRADVVGAICRGVARAKLMAHRVELPEVIIDEILEWIG
jgi:hypothetical protein